MKLEEVILYVHPSVFTNGGILDKYIRDKVIPYILYNGVYLDVITYNRNCTLNIGRSSGYLRKVTPKVVISDSINKFFITTSEGDVDNASDIILNNLNDFFTYMNNG